jgi:epoxyqueuosine reductase
VSLAELTSADVKARAREIGAHLVGVAAAAALPGEPQPPERVLKGARSVIVLARRLLWGAARIGRPDSRAAHYSAEVGLSALEEQALELCLWLEDHGHPSLVLPVTVSRSLQERAAAEGPIDLVKAAVEAGLGTMGLNGMLLTREFGPRVILGGVLTYASLAPDARQERALCRGEACGRCLSVCPGQAVRQWDLDVAACERFSSPYGYWFFREHLGRIQAETDAERRWERVRGTDTLMVWQSMLRGVGVITGCTRCMDVCPVGEDFEARLADALADIPEEVAELNRPALEEVQGRARAGDRGPGHARRARWIGRLEGP